MAYDDYDIAYDAFERMSDNNKLEFIRWRILFMAANQVLIPEDDAEYTDAYANVLHLLGGGTDDLSTLTDDLKVRDRYLYNNYRKICKLIKDAQDYLDRQES